MTTPEKRSNRSRSRSRSRSTSRPKLRFPVSTMSENLQMLTKQLKKMPITMSRRKNITIRKKTPLYVPTWLKPARKKPAAKPKSRTKKASLANIPLGIKI